MNTMLKGLAFMSALALTKDLKRDEKGAAFTEYVALIALVVAGMIGVLALLWPALTTVINGAIADLP
jgi:Flp pilus assembly pilin Flp